MAALVRIIYWCSAQVAPEDRREAHGDRKVVGGGAIPLAPTNTWPAPLLRQGSLQPLAGLYAAEPVWRGEDSAAGRIVAGILEPRHHINAIHPDRWRAREPVGGGHRGIARVDDLHGRPRSDRGDHFVQQCARRDVVGAAIKVEELDPVAHRPSVQLSAD